MCHLGGQSAESGKTLHKRGERGGGAVNGRVHTARHMRRVGLKLTGEGGGSRHASLGKGERREGRERQGSPHRLTERSGSPLSPGRWGDDQGEFDDEDLAVAAEVDAFFEGMFL